MRVLISNDDGIDAPGLALLERAALLLTDDVWVVAPDGNRSGYGHGITLRRSFEVTQRGPRRYACSGTPADCVIAGVSWLFRNDRQPDLVLSGINEGRNVAEDVAYSGTMAVAREAALCGIPAVAFSRPRDSSGDEDGERWLADRLHGFWLAREQWSRDGHWLNVNLPRRLPAALRAARRGSDKVATQVIIHSEREREHALIEPLALRRYLAGDGDENALIDAGFATVTCLNWHGHSPVPAEILHESSTLEQIR
ncbi:5'/3'-nucleotidase SurE [Kerstersia similis]|uniref:5'/3'-nucleotidase SurE n=1 Tax=Kerstersia similis TaxID=206505 RepID=UPI0039EDF53D